MLKNQYIHSDLPQLLEDLESILHVASSSQEFARGHSRGVQSSSREENSNMDLEWLPMLDLVGHMEGP